MTGQARNILLVGLGCGLLFAGVSAAVLWRLEHADPSRPLTGRVADHADVPAQHATPEAVEALIAEMEGLKAENGMVGHLSGEMQSVLTALRSQLTQMDRNQEALHSRLTQVDRNQEALRREIKKVTQTDRILPGSTDADAPTLTPEEQDERAQTQLRAQIELLEGMRRAESPDPQWASTAQRALDEVFHSQTMPGMQVLETDCRTTLCRLGLFFDGSMSPHVIFRELVYLAPWQAQSFIHINGESGEGVVYLAREGYALPQARE